MRPFPAGIAHSTAPLDLRAAGRDLWPRDTLAWWQGRTTPRPARVCWPGSDEEVASVLSWATAVGVPVVPYGAGSGVGGGARGAEGSVVIDTKRLDRIGPLDPEARTVEVEAGVLGEHLEAWLADRGYTLGHSPSSISCSTVGGWAAARSAGQFSSRYGVFEDMVLALRAVTPGRGALRLGLDGDGPEEWLPMFLGSEGTLGVVTRVTLRIHPLPTKRVLRGYRFRDLDRALLAMRRLMQGELHPAVLRLYDPVDTRIGGRTKPKGDGTASAWWDLRAAVRRVPGASRRLLSLPLSLPGLVNRLVDGLAGECLLIAGWEGDAEVVDALAPAGWRILDELGDDLGPGPGERWYASRHAVSYKLMPVFEGGGFADTMEVACPWSRVRRVYDAVRAAVRDVAVVMCHMSHAYPEGCSLYFSFAGRGTLDAYDRTWEAALDAAVGAGGTTTHHHGIGRLKRPWASAEIGPAVEGWRRLAEEVDPAGICAPEGLFSTPRSGLPLPPLPEAEDGLVLVAAGASLADREAAARAIGAELAWPWADRPLPRWQREPWQTGWTDVLGDVGGVACHLGRGPRSATGPDLRGWLEAHGRDVRVTVSTVPLGERWMGVGRPEHPWRVAQALLRSDLRPVCCTVEDGSLVVGFRGPAAAALGALASHRVPGGLTPVAYRPRPLPAGPLEACAIDDPDVVHVNAHRAFRRAR